MVFGGVDEERLQFNEDTLWTGQPHDYDHEGAVKFLPQLRELLFAGKQNEAENLAMKEFMSIPLGQKAYQPCADLLITFPAREEVAGYRRELDLDEAITRVRYQHDGATYATEAFASHPDQVIVWHVTADQPGQVEFTARLQPAPFRGERLVRDRRPAGPVRRKWRRTA